MMTLRLLACLVAAYVGWADCSAAPTDERERLIHIPLASVYSDIAFSMTSGARVDVACEKGIACAAQSDRETAIRFALQVQQVAETLQQGAQSMYPDLAKRVPGLVGGRFDVYVVEGNEPDSDSSANGRIALSSALGGWHPYDAWLAFVIAREMGHVIARHAEENSAASITTSVIMNLLIPGSGLLKSVFSAAGSGIAAASNREVQAHEADAIALGLLRMSGFPLGDVSLALRLAPKWPDTGTWSRKFSESSSNLLAQVRRAEFAAASVVEPRIGQDPAVNPDN